MIFQPKPRTIYPSIALAILGAVAMTIPTDTLWLDELLWIVALIFFGSSLVLSIAWALDEIDRHRFYADSKESSHMEMVRTVSGMSSKQLDFIDQHWPAVRIEIRPRDEGALRFCYFSGEPIVYEAVVEIMEAVDDRGYLPAINDNTLKIAKRHDLEKVSGWLVTNGLAEGPRGNLAARVYDWNKAALALGVIWN